MGRKHSRSKPVRYHLGKFPPKKLAWERLVSLIGPANAAVGRYDALLMAIPNADILLAPLTTQEAVLSSRIEGTQATMGEVLEFEARKVASSPEKQADILEVLNYRQALRDAVLAMEKLPLAGRVIREAHATLLAGVRGHDKSRGKYRTEQNWIGSHNCPLSEARFVPISPDRVQDGMSSLEKFIHADFGDKLVQLALVHAEFESLHPFLDGNGRVGRMLVPLFLFEMKLLHKPMFYVSEYLERHRQEYCDHLLAVSSDDRWTEWCIFFLEALIEQAGSNEDRAKRILELYQSKKNDIVAATHSQHAISALDFLFNQPVFNSSDFIAKSEIPEATSRRILRQLTKAGVLKVLRESSGQQAAIYAFPELINIAEGRRVF